jgi:hypothetical protein
VEKKPNKTLDSLKYVAISSFFPTTLKSLGIYVLLWHVLQPLAGMIFPRAEDVLKQEGLNPELVQELAPNKKVYIRQGENIFAKAHAVLDNGFLISPLRYLGIKDDSGNLAETVRGHLTGKYEDIIESPLCLIYIKPRNLLAERLAWGSASVETRYQEVLLHEIRHCSAENRKLSNDLYIEGDAEYYAIKLLAREKKSPQLLTTLFNLNAVHPTPDDPHNTSLYIDARLENQIPPSDTAIYQANNDSEALLNTARILDVLEKNDICLDPQYDCLSLREKFKNLSPLAQKRLDFGVKAYNELSPLYEVSVVKKDKTAKDKVISIKNKFAKPPEIL